MKTHRIPSRMQIVLHEYCAFSGTGWDVMCRTSRDLQRTRLVWYSGSHTEGVE